MDTIRDDTLFRTGQQDTVSHHDLPHASLQEGVEPPNYQEAISMESLHVQHPNAQPPAYSTINIIRTTNKAPPLP